MREIMKETYTVREKEDAWKAELSANVNKIASALVTDSLDLSLSNTSLHEMMKQAFKEAISEYMRERDAQIAKLQSTVDAIAVQSTEQSKRLEELYQHFKLEPIPGSRSETHARKENKQKPKSLMQRFWDWLEEEPASARSPKQSTNN
jgi:uncharacterized coiled-coil DUF342 family protein